MARSPAPPALVIADEALAGRALVYGALPPEGRDLDLLVREGDRRPLADALRAAGFLQRDGVWVRFIGCDVEIVEIAPAEAWDLPAAELDALFAEGRPLEGLSHVVRPAPHHVLLILARRCAAERRGLDTKRRARADRACAEDPHAWSLARARACAWGVADVIDRLERAPHEGLAPVPPPHSSRLRRPLAAGGAVIAMSGLDGAGKSSQAAALRETLERLGFDVTVAWTRFSWDDRLWRLALPVKSALTAILRLRRRRPTAASAAASPPATDPDPVKRIREGSRLLTHTWTSIVALSNAISQRRMTRPQLRRGGIVICDRYTLDSIVALRFSYGTQYRFRLQRALIARLSPAPRRAYLLDVPAETAYARKGEYSAEWLAAHRVLYLEEHVGLGVRLLDGRRPREDLCAEIALDVWQSGLPPAGPRTRRFLPGPGRG
jgi:thymidylate kinase